VQTYYSDNEELLAKLAAGAKGYDVLVPTANAVQALIKGGQLRPLDKAQLPNLKNVDPAFLPTAFDPGNQYAAPYAMSTTILGYNDEKMKELGLPTDTWAVIFDPKLLEKVKGRVTVLDSSSELFAAALNTSATRPMTSIRSTGTRLSQSSRKRNRTGPRSTRRRTSRS
jgi:spermidine/putrescine transport system substrate-binding protein